VALEAMLPVEAAPEIGPGIPVRLAEPPLSLELGMISVRPNCSWLPSNRVRVAGLKNMLLMSEPPALMPA
jgi:hypothetical protein